MYAKLQVNVRYAEEAVPLAEMLASVGDLVEAGNERGEFGLPGGVSVEWDLLVDPGAERSAVC
jgi:hypothetical protein